MATSPVVPGATQGTTPPTFGGQGQGAPGSDVLERLKAVLAQAAQRKQFAGQPKPVAVPGQQSTQPPGYMTSGSNPHAWGAQRMMSTLQSSIKNAVNQHKQKQVAKAEADYEYLGGALNELYSAQQTGDQKSTAAAQSKVDVILGDPKKLKNMAKALNQDWLNPEKTTVYGEAMKSVLSQTQQKQQQKSKAAQGIQGIFKKLAGRQQQPQLTPDQQKQMGQEIEAKAPTATVGGSVKDIADASKSILDVENASKAAREQYSVITSNDGKVWAINKSNPKDAFEVKDSTTGANVEGQTKASSAPKVLNIQGIPYGIQRGKDILTPESPNWSKDDQQAFDAAKHAVDLKQGLRIDPVIAAELGTPPDPADYAKGKGDPSYGKALRDYGLQAEAAKNRMAGAQGAARAQAYNLYRPVQVLDPNTGNVQYVFAKDAIQGGMAGAAEGAKLLSKTKQLEDIEFASKSMRSAITDLDRPFSPEQVAKLKFAMSTEDQSLASTELATLATQNLTDKQQDFVIWANHINERALSLRSIAGQGQGASDIRAAIRALLPGVQSGDKKFALKQLDAFDNQVKILKSGVPPVKGKTEDKDPLGILK